MALSALEAVLRLAALHAHVVKAVLVSGGYRRSRVFGCGCPTEARVSVQGVVPEIDRVNFRDAVQRNMV